MPRTAELRELPDEELLDRLESLKEELFNLRFQFATGQLDNPMRIKVVRHDVARILTLLRERHLEIELEEEVAKAEEESLERSREMQASGELKGDSLEMMIETSGPEEAPIDMGAVKDNVRERAGEES
jgi:large subunit ribosomal protein L29